MSLFSSFVFPSNSFFSWIDKSTLGLAGISIGPKPSYLFAISFRWLQYRTVLSSSKSFSEKPHITLYHFSESSNYTTISSVHWNFSLFSLLVSISVPHVFFFLLGGSLKFLLSTKICTFSAHMLPVIFYYWHACAHAKKLHRQGELSHLKRLYKGKEEISRPEDISATQYITFSKRFIG